MQEHLESGRLDAWRPALRILEHAWSRPKETVELQDDIADKPTEDLSLAELLAMRDRIVAKHAASSNGDS